MDAEIDALNEIQQKLIEQGWKWEWWTTSKGWWVLPTAEEPEKRMRRGDPKPYLRSALTTAYLYTDIEIPSVLRRML